MTEPQVWTLIGVFAAIMLGGMTLMTTLLMRTITSSISGLRGELHSSVGGLRAEMQSSVGGLRAEMNAKFETVHEKFDAKFDLIGVGLDGLDARLMSVEKKLEGLDRDVQVISRRVFDGDPK